ncbi:DUF2993 domain-containing protein [Leptolyngbya sp. FACHB-711]|uniref:LmeA family phospholipid-binding protein n=1 Tax=unclassified Leptolyngbya TaxID=2650499 RepID=UPI0016821514|nr:DUF2993 domain-containing protein [Leptolyngbya sp. FACHB-711]MBD1850146.1 DUF2993 domain-containing protein [Cyanobacteria bacterium FACHB-502]MBD2025553.1 DUF2993 domain-containing protein [Leptolyngbya sp. FACHB-711]
MPEEPRLDEHFVSQAIQLGLSSQLDNAEEIKVDVRTDLLKVIQGQADSVSVRGQGMVVQDLRVEEMELHTQELDLNTISLLLGKLELDKPLNATSRVVLTEADLNQAMSNQAIVNRIPPFKFQINGQRVAIALQPPLRISFPGNGKIAIDATVQSAEQGKIHHIRFSATAYHKIGDRPVLLESFQCHGGGAVSLELMLAMMQRVKELMELPYFQYEGMEIRIREMKAEVGKLVLQVETRMAQTPFG